MVLQELPTNTPLEVGSLLLWFHARSEPAPLRRLSRHLRRAAGTPYSEVPKSQRDQNKLSGHRECARNLLQLFKMRMDRQGIPSHPLQLRGWRDDRQCSPCFERV